MRRNRKTVIILIYFMCYAFVHSASVIASLDQGLVGHWNFDEGSGQSALDATDNNNDGAINGAAWTINGKLGQALQFDGQDDFIEVPYDVSLNLVNSFTVSVWIKLADDGANWLVSKGVYCSGPRAWAFSAMPSSTYNLFYAEDTRIDSVASGSTYYTEETWHQVVLVYEGGLVKFYQNGELKSTASINMDDLFSNTKSLVFGHMQCILQDPPAADYSYFAFNGIMDEIRIYARALVDNEILDLYITDQYNGGVPVVDTMPPSDPVSFGIENPLIQFDNRVDLKWDSSTDDIALKGYLIYRDGIQIADVRATAATIEKHSDVVGLLPATSYTYEILSYDVKGNRSGLSSPVMVTTSALQRLKAFPGSEGFAAFTVAGSGRNSDPSNTTLYKITNLNPNGSGSLKACIQAIGPRVCVFEVSGAIELSGDLGISNPFITIAGQTAPSPGITLRGGALRIYTNDVLVQHIRIRVGDNLGGTNPENRDAIGIEGLPDGSRDVFNVLIDHCSVSWAIDENIALWYPGVHNITISNSIISEGLLQSMHPKGAHSMGILIGKEIYNVSLIGNLLIHNNGRNPLIQGLTKTIISNNLIYNPGFFGVNIADPHGEGAVTSSLVGNVIIPGANSIGVDEAINIASDVSSNSQIFVLRNDCSRRLNDSWSCVTNNASANIRSTIAAAWAFPLSVISETEVEASVSVNAGARPAERDSVDQRLISELATRTGQLIDCVGSDDIPYVQGIVSSATTNTVMLDNSASIYDNGYLGRQVKITSGKGAGQTRNIEQYLGSAIRKATVDVDWVTIPDATSTYEISLDCILNAGGRPQVIENTRVLTIPANPNDDDDGDAYTNLENWLQQHAQLVTNPTVLPDLDNDGKPDLVDSDIDGDGFNNDIEITAGTNPEDSNSRPADGDINNDGKVDTGDLLLMTQFVLDITLPDASQIVRADVAPLVAGAPVPDGQINAADYFVLTRKVIGLLNF